MGLQQLSIIKNSTGDTLSRREVAMEPQTLEEFGLPNVVLHDDANAYYVDTGLKIGRNTDPRIIAYNPEGKQIYLTRNKTYGACFRAPWKAGIKHVNLAKFDLSRYYATEDGRIFGTRNMNYITPRLTNDGYEYVHLYSDSGDYLPWRVSRLIALAFIDNPEGKDTVDHIDCNRRNNHVSNLRWMWMWENDDRKRVERGLSDEKVHQICKCFEAGMTQTQIMRTLNIPRHFVKDIQRGSYYRITKDYKIPRYENQSRMPVEFRGGKVGDHGQNNRKHRLIIHNDL